MKCLRLLLATPTYVLAGFFFEMGDFISGTSSKGIQDKIIKSSKEPET